MSTASSTKAAAEVTIEFGPFGRIGCGDKLLIRLSRLTPSISADAFDSERLEKVLRASSAGIKQDLEDASWSCEFFEDRDSTFDVSIPGFPVVVSGAHFRVEAVVTVGALDIPLENIRFFVEKRIQDAIVHFRGLDIQEQTGVPATYKKGRLKHPSPKFGDLVVRSGIGMTQSSSGGW